MITRIARIGFFASIAVLLSALLASSGAVLPRLGQNTSQAASAFTSGGASSPILPSLIPTPLWVLLPGTCGAPWLQP